jgi:hypothetical protein
MILILAVPVKFLEFFSLQNSQTFGKKDSRPILRFSPSMKPNIHQIACKFSQVFISDAKLTYIPLRGKFFLNFVIFHLFSAHIKKDVSKREIH